MKKPQKQSGAWREHVAAGVLSLICITMLFTFLAVPFLFEKQAPKIIPKIIAGHTVKINTPAGHGSGVHIGGGLVLTAAHVVEHGTTFKMKTNKGETLTGEVLWIGRDYDLALLRTDKTADFAAVNVTCRLAGDNEPIHVEGNPYFEEFTTHWGYSNGKSNAEVPIKDVIRASMFFIPGMSGGPVLADNGDLLGIVSMGGQLPIGLYVPAPTICKLLARA